MPTMHTAAATAEVMNTRVTLESERNQLFARSKAALAVWVAVGGFASDTCSPDLLEGVEDLVSYGADQLDGDVGLFHRDHGAVEIVDRARCERVDLLRGHCIYRADLIQCIAQHRFERGRPRRFPGSVRQRRLSGPCELGNRKGGTVDGGNAHDY